MITECYPYSSHNNGKLYFFQSLGTKGEIVKVVKFSQIAPYRYNLGLADFEKGKLAENVVSNNFDTLKVMSTVAEIIKHFTLQNPERIVVILAIDERRLKFFNAIFNRRKEEISKELWIWGLKEDETEDPYDAENFYKGFIVKRKKLE